MFVSVPLWLLGDLAHHPEQGWSLLCNGVLLFEDTGELLPDGRIIAPHRPLAGAQVMTAA